ncbi:MAG: glycosyltransferase family 39 protein [Thermoanaerobaculia bacterium]
MSRRVEKRLALLALLLAVGLMMNLRLAATDSSTEDEQIHLFAGALLLTRGQTTINLEHPPLAKIAAAAPLLRGGALPPPYVDLWTGNRLGIAVADFAYRNALPLHEMLYLGRLPFVFGMILLGFAVASFVWRYAGPWSSIAAAALTLFSPLFLAVGHLVHTDLAVTLFATTAFFAGICALDESSSPLARYGWPLLSGLLWGAALLSKYSAVILLAGFGIAVILTSIPGSNSRRRRGVFVLAVAGAIAFATLWIGMAVMVRGVDQHLAQRLASIGTPLDRILFGSAPLRPLGLYWFGFESFLGRGAGVAVNYFGGAFSRDGWWFYFPVAFLLKTPLPTLLLLLLSAGMLVLKRDRLDLALLTPVLLYLFVSIFSTYNIGIRHLLPIYPLLFVWASRLLAPGEIRHSRTLRIAATILVCATCARSFVAWPHYMGFFGVQAGSRDTATSLLSDSNVDWGQDNSRLASLLRARGMLPARVLLMGGSLPEVELGPGFSRLDPDAPLTPGTYAVSRTLFVELTAYAGLPPESPMRRELSTIARFSPASGLRLMELQAKGERIATVGNSIDVYLVKRAASGER